MSNKKVNNIFKLMELFVERRTICKNGNILTQQGMVMEKVEELGMSVRNLRRYLDEIEQSYPHITKIKKEGSICYKLESTSEIFHTFLSNREEISWLLQLIHESDKNLLEDLAKETHERLEKISKHERDVFLFQGLPFNELNDARSRDIFNMLKLAIKNCEYRDIHYQYNIPTILKNAQCLKLLFMDSNWYIAIASQEKGLLLLRMAFISHVEYSKKETYQPTQLIKYKDYLQNIQSPMTLYGVEKQIGYFLASPKVAKYFMPHMKKYLSSQTFIEQHKDGSVEFSLEYTQALEVLPFIKRWLPEIEVLSPLSLQELMLKDVKEYLEKYKGAF
jgi:predicted DNA-binding transcriptional regulator YafY